MGGLAFQARTPGWIAPVERPQRDIDLVIRHEDRSGLGEVLTSAGYSADRHYNALHGHKQLYFEDRLRRRPVDVIVDRLEMCHRLDLRDRFRADRPTLPLADLLLSKLQIVRINRKDVLDVMSVLHHHALGDTDGELVNVRRIVEHTSADWGWWRTVTGNLAAILSLAGDAVRTELETRATKTFDLSEQVRSLLAAIEAAPKSARWSLRAVVGERVRWYQEPEEVRHPAG